jgi:predicted peroxiredoxin
MQSFITGFAGHRRCTLGSLLVNITTGTENPTKAALGLLVASVAAKEGHDVTVFLAGDGVQLVRDSVLDSVKGIGTGSAREHLDALLDEGVKFFASGMSSKARGITEADAEGKAQMAMPDVLVRLIMDSDRTVTY